MNSPQEKALEKARKHLHNAYTQLLAAYALGEYAKDIDNALTDTQRAQQHIMPVDVLPDYKHIH
jgi:hypothetical protein